MRCDLIVHMPKSYNQLFIGLGTEVGTFKGTYRIASVLPSTDSHEIIRYLISVPENAFGRIQRETEREPVTWCQPCNSLKHNMFYEMFWNEMFWSVLTFLES